MSNYTRWYREGTIAVDKNGNTVTGTNTFWMTAGLHVGDIMKIGGSDYEITGITDNTHLTISPAFSGSALTEGSYAIIRNFTSTMQSEIASKTSELLGDFAQYIDSDMKSIHGKSAYQIACDKGYTGTETEWVESLKGDSAYTVAVKNGYSGTEAEWLSSLLAAGEWDELDARTDIIYEGSENVSPKAGLKNSIFRGKNLGAFTSEHLANIRNGSFKGMWLGDYFTFEGDPQRFRIAGFNNAWYVVLPSQERNMITIVPDFTYNYYFEPGYTLEEGEVLCYGHSTFYKSVRPGLETDYAAKFSGAELIEHPCEPYETEWGGYQQDNADWFGYYAKSWARSQGKVHMITTDMMRGHHFLRHKGYNLGVLRQMVTMTQQLPLFRVAPQFMVSGKDNVNTIGWVTFPDILSPGYKYGLFQYGTDGGGECNMSNGLGACRVYFYLR